MKFSNNPKDLLINIYNLPEEVVWYEVYPYIPQIITIFLTRKNYLQCHHLIKQYIPPIKIENYYRAMVRQDNDFVFRLLLVENKNKWLNMKKYYYKSCVYTNYITFLEHYAIEYESTKCREIINNLSEELGFNQNQHKKKILKYIIWKT
jgi:hypothetical protein